MVTKNAVLLHDATLEELRDMISMILKDQVEGLKRDFQPKSPTEFLTRTEVAELLKCNISTVHNWTKRGKLKPYGIGNRVYYKRSEIEEILLPLKASV